MTASPRIHYVAFRRSRHAACLTEIRFTSNTTQRIEHVTCTQCLARIAGGYLSKERGPGCDSVMDALHMEALRDEGNRKYNARRAWEQEALIDLCHEAALDCNRPHSCECGHGIEWHDGDGCTCECDCDEYVEVQS